MKTVLLFPFPSPQTILREIMMKVFQTICAWITGGTPLVFYRETPLARVVFPLRRVFPVARLSLPLPLKTMRQWILFCLLSKGGPVWIGRYQGLAHLRKWSTIEHHRQGCPCPAQEATVSSMLSCTRHTQLQEPSFGPLWKGIQSFLIKCFKCCILSRFTRVGRHDYREIKVSAECKHQIRLKKYPRSCPHIFETAYFLPKVVWTGP